ncbi:hypothetical protein BDK51DRAFT_30379 [Blyttiomyces helicus]|uniref:Uncharacterized protein n=1 Tax=Blyttiomyces helicus TaxID=388810 RepID=A0A4P9WNT7_9FUNG|nr:hypothetical protein BDK51DRAFT_30379 [Blyttiomyces helicus]|eukprot:RKO93955.1 hypothetical protein BDK51DRAFT_30379 [Blyttiomyces helicus]
MSSQKKFLAIESLFKDLSEKNIVNNPLNFKAMKPTVRIRDYTDKDVVDILNLEKATLMMVPWKRKCESNTRTRIDRILLCVFPHAPVQMLSCWGKVLLKWENGNKALRGLLTTSWDATDEAPSVMRPGAASNIWQIVAYCGIVPKSSIPHRKNYASVYGFLTNGSFRDFIQINNHSQVWKANVEGVANARTWLDLILDCARKSEPNATPTMSVEDLRNKLERFHVVVQRFKIKEEELKVQDEGKGVEQLHHLS